MAVIGCTGHILKSPLMGLLRVLLTIFMAAVLFNLSQSPFGTSDDGNVYSYISSVGLLPDESPEKPAITVQTALPCVRLAPVYMRCI